MADSEVVQNQRLLTSNEVAEILQVSRSYAYTLLRKNEIATVRIGRAVRVRPADLQRFIEASVHVAVN